MGEGDQTGVMIHRMARVRKYGVTHSMISKIRRGENWTHIPLGRDAARDIERML